MNTKKNKISQKKNFTPKQSQDLKNKVYTWIIFVLIMFWTIAGIIGIIGFARTLSQDTVRSNTEVEAFYEDTFNSMYASVKRECEALRAPQRASYVNRSSKVKAMRGTYQDESWSYSIGAFIGTYMGDSGSDNYVFQSAFDISQSVATGIGNYIEIAGMLQIFYGYTAIPSVYGEISMPLYDVGSNTVNSYNAFDIRLTNSTHSNEAGNVIWFGVPKSYTILSNNLTGYATMDLDFVDLDTGEECTLTFTISTYFEEYPIIRLPYGWVFENGVYRYEESFDFFTVEDYEQNYQNGYEVGLEEGYQNGYDNGYQAGIEADVVIYPPTIYGMTMEVFFPSIYDVSQRYEYQDVNVDVSWDTIKTKILTNNILDFTKLLEYVNQYFLTNFNEKMYWSECDVHINLSSQNTTDFVMSGIGNANAFKTDIVLFNRDTSIGGIWQYNPTTEYYISAFSMQDFIFDEVRFGIQGGEEGFACEIDLYGQDEALFDLGYTAGFDEGRHEGYNEGYDYGYTEGTEYGETIGFNKGLNEANDYTFKSLFLAVFDAPLQTFYGLFNFELLGYNMSSFVLTIFTLVIVLAVVKIILNGGG